MTSKDFQTALNFVWGPGRDSPRDGYHVTPDDPGGGTFGGVIEATWQNAIRVGLIRSKNPLAHATLEELSEVLRARYWGDFCDVLPPGLNLLMFNGRMMSGAYPRLFQQGLGFICNECDGCLGPLTIAAVSLRDPETLIEALTGIHYSYLRGLDTWKQFGAGWTARLRAAREAALSMLPPAPLVAKGVAA